MEIWIQAVEAQKEQYKIDDVNDDHDENDRTIKHWANPSILSYNPIWLSSSLQYTPTYYRIQTMVCSLFIATDRAENISTC